MTPAPAIETARGVEKRDSRQPPQPVALMKARLTSLLLILTLTGVGCQKQKVSPASAPTSHQNSVVAYLGNAERQSETDDQRREIQKALEDMLRMTPSELKAQRYADYEGKPGAWSVTELLKHYFVPDPMMALDDEQFYKDVGAAEARAAIQRQLDAVKQALQEDMPPKN